MAANPPQLRSSRLNLIVAVVVLAVLVIAGIVFFTVRGAPGVIGGGSTGAEAVGDSPAGPKVDNLPITGASSGPAASQGASDSLLGLQTVTWEALIGSLNVPNAGDAANLEQIVSVAATVSTAQPINIVEALGLEGLATMADRQTQLQAALLTAGPTLNVLRDAVAANQALADRLAAAGYSALDVVALSRTSDGGVLVFVQPLRPSPSVAP